MPDLRRRPRHRAHVGFDRATGGIQRHRFAGPRLYDVLAGPGSDPARRKDRPRFLIAVTGTDGHHAPLSWAEVDPDFAGGDQGEGFQDVGAQERGVQGDAAPAVSGRAPAAAS